MVSSFYFGVLLTLISFVKSDVNQEITYLDSEDTFDKLVRKKDVC